VDPRVVAPLRQSAQHRRLSAAERAYIHAGQPAAGVGEKPVPWLALFGYRAVWAYLAASVLAGPVWNIYMFFLPDFLQKRYHLPLVQVGDWTAVFYFVASFGGVAGGWLFGRLLGRGWTVNAARKPPCWAAHAPWCRSILRRMRRRSG